MLSHILEMSSKDYIQLKCDLCKMGYPSQRELHEHLRLEHKLFIPDDVEGPNGVTDSDTETTKFICKVCGQGYGDSNLLDAHITTSHHSKRTITVHDIVNVAFDGVLNYTETKVEIIKKAESTKNMKSGIMPEIMDILRNLPDKRFNDEAELAYAIQSARAL